MGVALDAVLKKYELAGIQLAEQALLDAVVAAVTDFAPAAYQPEIAALEGLVLPVIKQWLDAQVAKV